MKHRRGASGGRGAVMDCTAADGSAGVVGVCDAIVVAARCNAKGLQGSGFGGRRGGKAHRPIIDRQMSKRRDGATK